MKIQQELLVGLLVLMSTAIAAQTGVGGSPSTISATDYARAEQFLNYKTGPLVVGTVRPNWTSDNRVWFRRTDESGSEFMLFDPRSGKATPAFDHERLAQAISKSTGTNIDAHQLPFTEIEFLSDGHSVSLSVHAKQLNCDLTGYVCVSAADKPAMGDRRAAGSQLQGAPEELSPDGKKAVFIRDFNLWLRNTDSGKERQITTDGVKDFGYATDNAGWTRSDRPVVLWSPDSKKIATFQQDERGVGEMYLVNTQVGHPQLEAWKYPLPGDPKIVTIQRVIIDVDAPRILRLKIEPDQHRGSQCDDLVCRRGEWDDVQWSPDAAHLMFLSTSRDHKHEQLRLADVATGEVRDVLEETVATQYESGIGRVNWRYLPQSNEIIWYSERDNWGHLYLYDLATGKLKNQITTGDWVVTQLLRVDAIGRKLYFQGAGHEKGRDPYFAHFYSVGFDGNGLKLLTPEDSNHDITLSPGGNYFVDSYSRPEVPAVVVLRDLDGKMVGELGRTDISRLVARGWKPPIPFTVKARDGETDLFGLMYRPTNFDEKKKYPIVNHIYPGPQGGSVGSRSFSASRGDAQALAELGFVVIELDGMGNPLRSKKFQDVYYGNFGDNTLPDQIAGMKQLAQRFSWIDLDRVGIYGHSGGGFAAADAMFRYPDFFKVGISEAGNHDNREYEDDWGERYQGLLEKKSDGTTNYDDQANQNMAKNLKGHLLLAHGTMDNNVPPYNTLLVVDALIKANKDFDLIMLPNRKHGFGNEGYMVRRRWDYFVRYLLGAEPPKEFELKGPSRQ